MSIYFCCWYRWLSLTIKIANSPENVVDTFLTRFLVFDPVPSVRIPGMYILQWNKFDNWDNIVVREYVNRYEQFFVDAKRVIWSHKSKTGRQCNGQSKKDKMINSGLKKKLHRKLMIEQHESYLKCERNSVGDNLSL